MMIPDMASGQVSIQLGAKGINSCSVTACASGANSIGDAFKVIERGDADAIDHRRIGSAFNKKWLSQAFQLPKHFPLMTIQKQLAVHLMQTEMVS